MDFERLMQQANANQLMAERKHERKKTLKDEEKKRTTELKYEREKRAVERLKWMKHDAFKKKLEYKGLISSQGVVDTRSKKEPEYKGLISSQGLVSGQSSQSLSCSSSSSSSSSSSKVTVTHHGESKKATSKETVQASTSSKKKDSATKPACSSQKPASKTSLPSLPVKPKPKGPPMSYADLMKMAEKNKDEERDRLKVSPSPLSSREASPASMSLSKQANQRRKDNLTHHVDTSVCVTGDGKAVAKSLTNPANTSARTLDSSSQSKKSFSPTKTLSHTDLTRRSLKQTQTSKSSNCTNRTDSKVGGVRVSPPSSKQVKPQPSHIKTNPAKTNSFYGAVNAKLLNQDRRALQTSLASRNGPVKHTSSWVSEMSEHLREKMKNGCFVGEEDEEELDGFVTSDDDFIDDGEGAKDYSAAIREIFGYDKTRFSDERFDDSAMESSYAQQEFEEQRSARIGRLEDEEDMRLERQQVQRKRKKAVSGGSGGSGGRLKQARLSFR